MRLRIEGKPTPLARPRMGRGQVYDPQRKIKDDYILQLRPQLPPNLSFPLLCPLIINLLFLMQIPKSMSKKKQKELVLEPHTSRPDVSNMVKFIEDVLQDAEIIKDDCTIYEIRARKLYAYKPATVIDIYQLNLS